MNLVSRKEPAEYSNIQRAAFLSVVLCLMGMLMIGSSSRESLTADELLHIPAGLSYWQQRDARMNVEHPPPLKMLAALPLFATGTRLGDKAATLYARPGSRCDNGIALAFFSEQTSIRHVILLARLPMVVLTLLMGLSVYEMAYQLGGFWGAAISLTVFASSPLFLAHGPLVTTDVGVTFFSLLTAWALADLWITPTAFSLIRFSLALAGALLAKFSGLLLLPALVLFALWMLLAQSRRKTNSGEADKSTENASPVRVLALDRVLAIAIGVVCAIVVCYAFYWIAVSNSSANQIVAVERNYIEAIRIPERFLAWTSRTLQHHPNLGRPLMPLWIYLAGIGFVNAELTRPVYLLGHRFVHGVWFYFPLMTLYKSPPAQIGLFLMLAACALVAGRRHLAALSESNRTRVRAILSVLVVFVVACMRSRINIGLRHFAVPLLLLILLLALLPGLVSKLWNGTGRRIAQAAIFVLCVSSIASALLSYPNYIPYYNWLRLEVPKQEIAIDSNLDWGQGLIQLDHYVRRHGIRPIYVDDRATLIPPQLYIEGAIPWKCDDPSPPAPEWVAVSADFLIQSPPTCAGLLRYAHVPIAGDAMYVFHVTDAKYAEEAQRYHADHPDESVAPIVRFRKTSKGPGGESGNGQSPCPVG